MYLQVFCYRLGLVADPVIQAIGRLDFEDGLRAGTTVEVITDTHSVNTNPEVSVRPLWEVWQIHSCTQRAYNPKPAVVGSVPV